jgi:hypothetical protein
MKQKRLWSPLIVTKQRACFRKQNAGLSSLSGKTDTSLLTAGLQISRENAAVEFSGPENDLFGGNCQGIATVSE